VDRLEYSARDVHEFVSYLIIRGVYLEIVAASLVKMFLGK
jgi:hypothetical protein